MKTEKPPPKTGPQPEAEAGFGRQTRRSFLDRLGVGTLLAAVAGQAAILLRALAPDVLYEPPRRFKIGRPDEFPEGATFLDTQRLFIFRNKRTFYSISASCTHLGCTVKRVPLSQARKVQIRGQWEEEKQEFHCPCHGSKYYGDGTNYSGPAPAPLAWYRLEIASDDGQLIVNLTEPVGQDFRLTV